MKSDVEVVGSALSDGTASEITLKTLQSLLGVQDSAQKPISSISSGKIASSSGLTSRHASKATSRKINAAGIAIKEDDTGHLTPKSKQAFATEVVNITLKVLTNAARTRQECIVQADAPITQAALNATAESACLAFQYLLAVDAKAPCAKENRKWQLENGVLALTGRLISLRLDTLATKCLKLMKRRLSAAIGDRPSAPPSRQAVRPNWIPQPQRPTLAALLHLPPALLQRPDLLGLAVYYQQLVLKIIALTREPAAIEGLFEAIALSAASSPANIIVAHANALSDHHKAAKQLESLVSTILSLCPSVSSASDTLAADARISIPPEAAFKLQATALSIRQMWWKIAGHHADLAKELHGPFLKCLTAFVRRSRTSCQAHDIAQDAYTKLSIGSGDVDNDIQFENCRLMCSLAEATATQAEVSEWAARMNKYCKHLDAQHARAVASLAEQVRIQVLLLEEGRDDGLLETAIDDLSVRMKASLSGHGSDYDFLLSSLSRLLGNLRSSKHGNLDDVKLKTLAAVAAGFAQRYARSYPGRNFEQALTIVLCALKYSKTSEDFDCWLSKDAARLLIDAGTLDLVAKAVFSKSLAAAWTMSRNAIALGRILRALLLKAIRARADETYSDDENVADAARGGLLEWQLVYAMELAARPKYHDRLRECIAKMLRVLSQLYVAKQYPIRRARVATCAFQLRSSHPDLLPPHVLKVWQAGITLDIAQLGEDESLRVYLADVKACLTVTKAFCDGRPSMESLVPALCAWQSIITCSDTAEGIYERVDDCSRSWSVLRSVSDYMAVTGESARLAVLRMLAILSDRVGSSQQQAVSAVNLAHAYLEIGHAEKAKLVLSHVEGRIHQEGVPLLAQLLLHIGCIDCALATDNQEAAQDHLAKAQTLRADLPPQSISRDDRRIYELLHVKAYLVKSKLERIGGAPHEALDAAKRAVRLVNGIWAALERATGREESLPRPESVEADPTDVQRLTTGVSKLQLITPKDESKAHGCVNPSDSGAAFWPLLPLMCRALQQLSDLYAHHGLFSDAHTYSKRAIELAEQVGASTILCQALCHRCRLLVLADDLQEAELCLTKAEEIDVTTSPLHDAERRSARAALFAKEAEYKQAIQMYEQAIGLIDHTCSPTSIARLETLESNGDVLADQMQAPKITAASQSKRLKSSKSARAPAKRPDVKKTAVRAIKATTTTTPPDDAEKEDGEFYMVAKRRREVMLDKALLCLQSGAAGRSADLAKEVLPTAVGSLHQQRVQFYALMQKASTALQSDLSYNMLPESTIAFPAFARPSRRSSQLGRPRLSLLSLPPTEQTLAKGVSKASARKAKEMEGFLAILKAAKDCISQDSVPLRGSIATVDMHRFGSMQSNASILLSAATLKYPNGHLHPTRQALEIELPRMHAWQCEASTIHVDEASCTSSAPFVWPQALRPPEHLPLTASTFQERYVDILPSTWTAVSIALNEDCTELYITRYRSCQSPMILRLPFARHRQDKEEQEAFDYHCGKAELKDIIQASDYTCHSAGTVEGKGAKSNWWSEREALDRRLHELLINMENIWLGGFKGIFSQQRRYSDLLARFRKTFVDILARYLPSRRAVKGRQKPIALDNKVLELFIGLGHDADGAVDMDEPLADLLYLVVDMLQFSGEQNAYDEIDFDSMAVDVLDALRSYHDALPGDEANGHLILVLDRRLQAFPWESMPCLEGASVSRVGSMQSLRERIVAIRRQHSSAQDQGLYQVSRKSGTYILNPSKDLKGTETMLSPSLDVLRAGEGLWTSMVQQAPSENDFSQALSESSILLYFGHGSGSQYIRPRKIKKLDGCSEVVWLMGCSSGALKEYGELEPFAVPLAYLMAGTKHTSLTDADYEDTQAPDGKCMAVVATLWDVTDKDIDRFSLALGEAWGLFQPSEDSKLPPKTPRKRSAQMAASFSPQKVPKTPKVSKTPSKAPARSRSVSRVRQADDGRKRSLVEAVARSRDACYLRYLNGAAPVVYGVPVYLGD
ncbi:hypothetical protein EJ03DRAFT_311394 [Teratosphaeria nubilosa]|uniref:separase n=1 Tax=Teratosphaeria nubilosa TaxID=161662 RepID=A0A6G1LAV1_9PEZI|nr:hypothetical protein EJ03DRAFT_311394 [Teratosphaeria nubilosa]